MKLNVGEVSLVDSPANEKEFLVTKNLEDESMGEQQETAERVMVEQPTGGESDVAAVLKHVNDIVANISNVTKGQLASAPAIAAGLGAEAETVEAADDDADVEKSSFSAMMKAAGVKMTPEQMEKLKAAGFDPSQKFPTAKKPAEKTTKAVAAPAAEEAEAALTIESLSSLITKAKKFTPGRVEKLKAAFDTLKGLLEEIDTVPVGTNPGVSTGASTSFGASGVKGLAAGPNVDTSKSATPTAEPSLADVVKAVNDLADIVKNQGVKLENIEKARPASNSVEGEGATADTKVKKSGSLWGGLL